MEYWSWKGGLRIILLLYNYISLPLSMYIYIRIHIYIHIYARAVGKAQTQKCRLPQLIKTQSEECHNSSKPKVKNITTLPTEGGSLVPEVTGQTSARLSSQKVLVTNGGGVVKEDTQNKRREFRPRTYSKQMAGVSPQKLLN